MLLLKLICGEARVSKGCGWRSAKGSCLNLIRRRGTETGSYDLMLSRNSVASYIDEQTIRLVVGSSKHFSL